MSYPVPTILLDTAINGVGNEAGLVALMHSKIDLGVPPSIPWIGDELADSEVKPTGCAVETRISAPAAAPALVITGILDAFDTGDADRLTCLISILNCLT